MRLRENSRSARAYRNTLGRHQDILKARFVRLHGYMTGQQDYDKFVTALANRHSRDSDVSTSSFCAAVDQATQTATAIAADAGKSDELEALVAFRPERAWYVETGCAAPVNAAAPALPQVTTSVSQPDASQIMTAAGAAVLQPVGATAAMTPQQVQYAPQSTAAALQAAAIALQSAAAALQMAQTQGATQGSPPRP